MERSNNIFMGSIWGKIFHIIPNTLVFIVLLFGLLIWEGICRGFEIPLLIIPPPSLIISALIKGITSGMIFVHIYTTLVEIFWGFLIGCSLGLVLGILVGEVEIFEKVLYPYIISFQALPKVAIAPLIILWFGFGLVSKIILVAVMCFFPLLVNVVAGLHATNPELLEMMRSIPATRWQTFKIVKLPSSLPYIFAGLDVAATLSIIGAVVGEFVGSERGLGNLVLQMSYNFDTGGMFSMFIILSTSGLLFHFLIVRCKYKLVFWIR